MATENGDLGNYEEALRLKVKCLQIRSNMFSDRNPKVDATLNNIGGAHENMGDTESARAHIAAAIGIYESYLGSDHPSTKIARENLARLS